MIPEFGGELLWKAATEDVVVAEIVSSGFLAGLGWTRIPGRRRIVAAGCPKRSCGDRRR